MKLKLNVGDRLHLLPVLPKEGNLLTARIVRKLRERIELSEKDIATYGVVEVERGLTWDTTVAPVQFLFTPGEMKCIRTALTDADKRGKVNAGMLPLYDLFMEESDGEAD